MNAELAGTLDRRVTLQRRADTRDDLGAANGAWADVATLWARIDPVAPGPWGEGDRPAARPRWQAVVRSGLEVRPGDRLRWEALSLAVRTVAAPSPDRLILQLEQLP